jgi:hypothetical protein
MHTIYIWSAKKCRYFSLLHSKIDLWPYTIKRSQNSPRTNFQAWKSLFVRVGRIGSQLIREKEKVNWTLKVIRDFFATELCATIFIFSMSLRKQLSLALTHSLSPSDGRFVVPFTPIPTHTRLLPPLSHFILLVSCPQLFESIFLSFFCSLSFSFFLFLSLFFFLFLSFFLSLFLSQF